MPRCCPAGVAQPPSIAPLRRATATPASPSCRWMPDWTRAICCCTKPCRLHPTTPRPACTIAWQPLARNWRCKPYNWQHKAACNARPSPSKASAMRTKSARQKPCSTGHKSPRCWSGASAPSAPFLVLPRTSPTAPSTRSLSRFAPRASLNCRARRKRQLVRCWRPTTASTLPVATMMQAAFCNC